MLQVPVAKKQPADSLAAVLAEAHTDSGKTLLGLVEAGTVLLIFLRHFGCSFCRQAISDVAESRNELARREITPVFVHLGTPERARPYFAYYGLGEVERISDPEARLYQSPVFGLRREHPIRHFLLPGVWKTWLTGSIARYGIGLIREDSYQMPGVFVLRDGGIVKAFRYRTIADQPDYLALIS